MYATDLYRLAGPSVLWTPRPEALWTTKAHTTHYYKDRDRVPYVAISGFVDCVKWVQDHVGIKRCDSAARIAAESLEADVVSRGPVDLNIPATSANFKYQTKYREMGTCRKT